MLKLPKIMVRAIFVTGFFFGLRVVQAVPERQAPAQTVAPPQAAQTSPKSEAPPITKEEEDAYRAIEKLKSTESAQAIPLSQEFLTKYALSVYRPAVYAKLVGMYMNSNQLDKLVTTGQSALRENADNLPVLAMMSTVLPRLDPHALDAPQRLDLAERYARRALALGFKLSKPEGVTQEQFEHARNESLAMAHAGLGLVYYRRGDAAASASELDQATKLDPTPDPIELYLLGDGLMKTKKYGEAAAAFDRCARAQWSGEWQKRCREGQAAALKASTTASGAGTKP